MRIESEVPSLDLTLCLFEAKYLPPPLALLPSCEAAGVGVPVHGQLRPVAPQHVRLGGGPTHGQVLLWNKVKTIYDSVF